VLDVLGGGPDEVYVGQTWHDPAARREQHIAGPRRAMIFRRSGRSVGPLRPDLLPRLEPLQTRKAALAAEAYVAAVLRDRGLKVHGGH